VEVLARLDKTTGLRVLCGAVGGTCRGELARVAILEGDRRVLCMLDGWRRSAPDAEGRRHWMVNNHSVARAAKATAAVRRGALSVDQLEARRRPRFRQPIPENRDVHRSAYGITPDNYVIDPVPKLGILADCPLCGRVNLLAAKLGVVAE
jgi:hypothetical protein